MLTREFPELRKTGSQKPTPDDKRKRKERSPVVWTTVGMGLETIPGILEVKGQQELGVAPLERVDETGTPIKDQTLDKKQVQHDERCGGPSHHPNPISKPQPMGLVAQFGYLLPRITGLIIKPTGKRFPIVMIHD